MQPSGIYEIRNTVNGKRYIGSSIHFYRRRSRHFRSLRKGIHHSSGLQRAWNKYGEESFQFQPLLICSPENLLLYEQIAIDGMKPEYNICQRAGSSFGVKHTEKTKAILAEKSRGNKNCVGKTIPPEARAKMSAAKIGRKLSLAHRMKISAASKLNGISEETRRKMVLSRRASGRHRHHKETLHKMSIAKKGKPWSQARRDAQRRIQCP